MCWESEDELYNGGKPFKITLRDQRGIMVTILADNYFGKHYEKIPFNFPIFYFILTVSVHSNFCSRLLQKGDKDPDWTYCQCLWSGRGGTCRRCPCIQGCQLG